MSSSLHLSYTIPSSFDHVYSSLLDLKKFGQLHPYMTSVETLHQKQEGIEYLVHEQLRLWGFIPMRPIYKATVIEVEKNKHIRYLSEVKNGLFLTIDFIIEHPSTQHIQLSEYITLEGIRLIHPLFLSLLKKSHALFFDALQKEKNTSV